MLFLQLLYFFLKQFFNYFLFFDETYYEKYLLELGNINIIFIKLFQWLNSEKELFSKFQPSLKKYLDNVPYNEKSIDKITLNELLKFSEKKGDKLEIDSFTPFKSGSISLIFIGHLNKQKIIIKLLRKNIKDEIIASLNLFSMIQIIMYPFLYFLKLQHAINNFIMKNKNILLNQIDLIQEKNNIKTFQKIYKYSSIIIIPKVYEEYTNEFSNLIVMKYLEGKFMHQLEKEEIQQYYPLFYKYLFSFLEHEIIHGDIHLGNILFLKNNEKYQIGLIDFGIIFKLQKKELDFIYDVLKSENPKELLKKFVYLLKNFIDFEENFNFEIVYQELYNFYLNNKNNSEVINNKKKQNQILKNNNSYVQKYFINLQIFNINIIRYFFYRINYYQLKLNERVSNILIAICLLNSFKNKFENLYEIEE